MMTSTPRWNEARRLLVIRLDGLGDLLMTTPAIAALHTPGRHITALVSEAAARAAPFIPDIDAVLVHQAPWMKPPVRADEGPPDSIVRRLRDARFDAAVIFTVATQSPLPAALLCYYAGIPLRLAHCRENPYTLLTDWVPEREPAEIVRHEVRRQLDLVAVTGAVIDDDRLRLSVPATSRERVARLLEAHHIPPSRWVLLHPGASAPSRRYPPEMFAEAASRLAERTHLTIVLCGGPGDALLLEDIRSRLRAPSVSFAGSLDFPDLAALIEAAPLLICNNSGPAHVAAAVGTRVVDIYALTNLQHTPWRVPSRVLSHDVPCRGCLKSVCPEGHHACLRGVPPARVAAAAEELLDRRPAEVPTLPAA